MDGRELRQYEAWKQEVSVLRGENQHLRLELMAARPQMYHDGMKIGRLEKQVRKLKAENAALKQRVKDLTLSARQTAKEDTDAKARPLIKPSVKRRRRKRPGRKDGHAAALRAIPAHVDVHEQVPLPKDGNGRESCPCCNTCLSELEDHDRLVEDLIPAKVVVKCYHTRSGWCPCCRKRVESRAPDQPPAANIPHGQLGINALSTVMALRITHRLPFRQVARVLADLPGITVCAGAITRQVQRIAKWLDGDFEKLLLAIRCAPHVHADETGWRTDGRNGYLWAVTSPRQTVYHVDRSHGNMVIRNLLGGAFAGTLVTDFYSAYSRMNCKKQKCLLHLLRELSDTAKECPAFASGPFFRPCRRVIKQMLRLKKQQGSLDEATYLARVSSLEKQLGRLADAHYNEANARRIAKRIRKHLNELTPFLREKDLDGTNNAAERALRPAVVARKISGGSRSKKGAEAWAKLSSLLRTAGQQGKGLLETIKSMLTAAWASQRPITMASGP